MQEDPLRRESIPGSLENNGDFDSCLQSDNFNNNFSGRKTCFEFESDEDGEEDSALLGDDSIEAKNEYILGLPWKRRPSQKMDLEAPVRGTHQTQSSQKDIDEVATQHHKDAFGRHSSSRRSKHHKEHQESKSTKEEVIPPQQQVQSLLGGETQEDGCGESGSLLKRSDSLPRLFTEMEELHSAEDGGTFWKETARWIKFEECVEAGGDRWSKPHVSSLSLHSLFELRSCICNGVVQLDMDALCLEHIADIVLDASTKQDHLPHDEKLRERLKDVILTEHEHQNCGLNAIKSVADMMSKRASYSTFGGPRTNSSSFEPHRKPTISRVASTDTNTEQKSKAPSFMKKIPVGAEACNVLVGGVHFLERPVIAFVRLQDSIHLDGITEVPIPTRFLFILLGPHGNRKRYHEIGRSIATLMADEIFHDVAYKARTRNDLLAGIDEFMSQVTVLPPSGWDSKIRIEPPQDLPKSQMPRLQPEKNESLTGSEAKLESPHGVGPELQRTGRLFGGLINDIKRKTPFYLSDFRDALTLQCVASFIFLYFAVLTPIVTFGGLLGDATHNSISAMESIFGGAMAGLAFHLFSGQPLTIIGSTGPILVFEKILFEICHTTGIKYLPFRWWIGTWTGLFCIVLVATDASSLVQYITRYTEESFSALISLIFIYEAFKKLIHISDQLPIWRTWDPDFVTHYECACKPQNISAFNVTEDLDYKQISWDSQEVALKSHHENHNGTLYRTGDDSYVCSYDGHNHNVSEINNVSWARLNTSECLTVYCGQLEGNSCAYTPDAMLMSVILFFGTFALSWFLKSMKMSRFFPTKVRSVISDFAVTIAICLMVLLDIAMSLETPKLHVPESFRPTRGDRTWFIHPLGDNEWWAILVAIVPAMICTILIFMDQQITAVIVNRKENKLKKGCGYHLDLLVVSIMMIICSMLGLPWFVAATVLSITHVNSLKMESESAAPGEAPKFLGVREQRVTGIMIFLLIGLSVFMTPVLAYIPMPVLYGVFLYMGVSSLKGVQFIDRCKLFFMPPKHQPDYIYLRHVPLPKVYLFTFFQVVGLVLLWVIKSTQPVSIIFPMMVAALVGVRKAFDFFLFTQEDLFWLDDIMPESTKRKREDKKKGKKRGKMQMESISISGGSVVVIEDEKVLKIPSSRDDGSRDELTSINISLSMDQTGIWKTIDRNELGSGTDLRERCNIKRRHGEDKILEQEKYTFQPERDSSNLTTPISARFNSDIRKLSVIAEAKRTNSTDDLDIVTIESQH